eukprot:jgi/Psemu1/36168/gm1.36168_g
MKLFSTSTSSPLHHNEQPGKVFNKSCSSFDLDTFFQEQQRRQLSRHQAAYYGEDLSPMMVPPTDSTFNKSLGGSVGTGTIGRSPVCVQDVKQFEPLHYNEYEYQDSCYDDAGGVAIDLLSESIHSTGSNSTNSSGSSSSSIENDDLNSYSDIADEEDDLLLGLGLDIDAQVQAHVQAQVQQPPLHQHQSLRKPYPLAPILEERKVTFAAKHVVLKVEDTDSCAIDQRFVHQVFDAVQVWFIPHHTEYNREERSNMWYSPEQMASMKEEAIRAKMAKRQSETNRNSDNNSTNTAVRVFQAELDKCSFAPLEALRGKRTIPSIGYSSDKQQQQQQQPAAQHDETSSYSRRCRYEDMIDAVLLEQYEQRLMCFRVYGRVDPNCGGVIDADRLAEVYSIVGDTHRAHERAVEKAKKYLSASEEQEKRDEDNNSVVSSSSSVNTVDDSNNNNNNKEDGRHGPKTPNASTGSNTKNVIKRTPSFNEKMAFETSLFLDRGVSSLFEVLLSPILEIRRGDLFLGVGEEMSIATP